MNRDKPRDGPVPGKTRQGSKAQDKTGTRDGEAEAIGSVEGHFASNAAARPWLEPTGEPGGPRHLDPGGRAAAFARLAAISLAQSFAAEVSESDLFS